MSDTRGVLIFSRTESERVWITALLGQGDSGIFTVSNALDALSILQKEPIFLFLADRDLIGMDQRDFKNIVSKINPDVHLVFISPSSSSDRDFALNIEEILKILTTTRKHESALARELSNLRKFSYAIADRLLQILEVNDRYLFNNDHRVADLSRKVAERMDLGDDLVDAIQMGALLRDLGRVTIHQQILAESKKLTQTELTPMKLHPLHSVEMLRSVQFPWNLDPIIGEHHEHYDGSGYPSGLKGRGISIGARIIAVADAYYAMTTDRPYRRAMTRDRACQEIRKDAGKQFDPEVVEVFLSLMAEEPGKQPHAEKTIVVFERDPNIAAMIKLSILPEQVDVRHVSSSIDALTAVRQAEPELIIADLDALEQNAFRKFYQTVLKPRETAGTPILLLVSDNDRVGTFDGKVEYLLKPFTMEQVKARINGILYAAPSDLRESPGLSGTLEDFSLSDIVQILSLGLKTAKVEIARGDVHGTIYLKSGRIVHAAVRELRGQSAFFELLRWTHGCFLIRHGMSTTDINITADTTHLLLEGAMMMDEKNNGSSPLQPVSAEDIQTA